MTSLLIDGAVKSSLLLMAALWVTRLLRRSSADLRHRIWLAALAAALLATLPLPVPDPVRITIATSFVSSGSATGTSSPTFPLLLSIWILGSTLLLMRFAAGLIRLSRLTGNGEVVVSQSVATPITWGAIRPVIVLPAYVMEWSAEQRELVLRHERAHVERRDWLWQSFAQVATALLWFHPMVWLAASELRREAELAADDMVVTSGAEAADYAARLIDVARHVKTRAPAAAVAMVRRPALTSRIAAILDASRDRNRAGVRSQIIIVLVAVASLGLLAACHNTQVYRIGAGVSAPKPISQADPEYSQEARKAKFQGTVRLGLVVDEKGNPHDIHVTKPLGLGLDEKAIAAVQKWRFQPGTKDGRPVRVAAVIDVTFKLL